MHPANKFTYLAFIMALPVLGQSTLAWKDIGGGKMELTESGKPALIYNYDVQHKEGAPDNRSRCCYIFPVYTPAGVSLLDDFPPDHWHHRGVFWSWPIVETGGKRYDNWMAMTARHRMAVKPVVTASPAQARLEVRNFWRADGRDIVREDLRLTAFPSQGISREFDIELTLEAVGQPVTLRGSAERGKSYGGLGARFAERSGTIVRADGEVLSRDEDLNPRRWAELEAVYNGRRALLRITPGPDNAGAPHQWCLRDYGFVGASFPGRTATVDGHILEPGNPLTLKFRVRVSDVP